MSYIKPKTIQSQKVIEFYKKRFEFSKALDPTAYNVDMLECNYKGIENIRYIDVINGVVFRYSDDSQGLHNVMVFCDIDTAAELDFNLDLIKEFPDIDMHEYFQNNFIICWDYVEPKIFRLFYCK